MKKLIKILTMAIVSVLACCMLVACVPSNVEKAEKKMEKAGYTIESVEDKDDDAEGVVGGFIAVKKGDGIVGALTDSQTLFALLFESKDDAKDYLEDYEDYLKPIYGEVTQKGKWVYAGTSDAVEAFEK